jgi:mono/diheme cytochrome c family protein
MIEQRLFISTVRHCAPLLALLALACEPKEASTTPDAVGSPPAAPADASSPPSEAKEEMGARVDTALGGQLFDKWFKVKGYTGGFLPDSKKTEELDGSEGPNGDGTLNDAEGKPVANAGHDYRLKNFFGWDLRGAEGIYGPEYQNKKHVLPVNLLTDSRDRAELVRWMREGGDGLPAFGAVLDDRQLEATAAFVIAVREGELPQPDQIFTLSKEAPKNYTLNAGADPKRGAELYAAQCAGCHGDKGGDFMIDDDYTLGAFGRMKAYEGWLKVVNGHPGSPMSRQSDDAREVLDIFAALCDREAFPPKDADHEVADGDLRCGNYLK